MAISWYRRAPSISVPEVASVCRAAAWLDLLTQPDEEYRYYSFDPDWGGGGSLASMRDGEGNASFIWFGPAGAAIRGFDHESVMSPFRHDPPVLWPGLDRGLPPELCHVLAEPAFGGLELTFLFWRQAHDEAWHHGSAALPEGDDPDGSGWLLAVLTGGADAYLAHARESFEARLDAAAVAHIYRAQPIDEDLVRRLNRDADIQAALDHARRIGLPVEQRED
jgi:hypothetical protein